MTQFARSLKFIASVGLLLALLALLAVACDGDEAAPTPTAPAETPGGTEGPPAELERVSLQLDWFMIPIYAPVVLADERGYFADEGLELDLQQGGPGTEGLVAVANGDKDFYLGAADEVPFGVAQGMNIKMVAAITHSNPNGIIVLSDSPIQSWQDLQGKTVAAPLGPPIYPNIFPAILESQGIDPSTVRYLEVDPATMAPSLIAGQFDALIGWDHDSYVRVLYPEDPDARHLAWRDIGWDFFAGFGLVTGQRIRDEKPDVVRRFVRAVLRGYADAVENPEETVDAAVNRFPEAFLEPRQTTRALEILRPVLETEDTKAHGLGYTSDEEWQSLVDTFAEYAGLEEVFSIDTYYTNDFLPEEPIAAP